MGFLDWKFEILGTVAALVALMAMVGTLVPHAGQPLPEWRYGISINTLLSIYTVVIKIGLLYVLSNCVLQLQWTWFSREPQPLSDLLDYDQASRGAWGSIVWLSSHHIREPATAIAALLTIASLAIDPFAQQLIGLVDCQTTLENLNATVPRTNSLINTVVADNYFFGRWATSSMLPGNSISSSIVCGSGNCTFPEYTTLGYCSVCNDVSSTMTFIQNVTNGEKWTFTTTVRWPDDVMGPNSDPDVQNLKWVETMELEQNPMQFTPHLSYLDGGAGTHWIRRVDGGWDASTSDAELQIIMPGTWFTANGRDPNTGNDIQGCTAGDPSPSWRCRGYGAASCLMYKCARAYTATVKNGVFNETLVASSAGVYWGGNPHTNFDTQGSGLIDMACLTSSQKEQVEQSGRLDTANNTNGRFFRYAPEGWNITETQTGGTSPTALLSLDTELVADGCLFVAFQGTDPDLPFNLDSVMFQSAVEARGYQSYTKMAQSSSDPDHIWDLSTMYVSSYNGSPELLSAWNNGDIHFNSIDAAFANLSDSLTTYVRINGDTDNNASNPATGQVLHYATCLEVRWAWITLPATLVVFVAFLLAFVAISASKGLQPLWRSSAFLLGWIYCGPGLDNRGPDASVASLEKQADKDIVVLETGRGGHNPGIRAVKNAMASRRWRRWQRRPQEPRSREASNLMATLPRDSLCENRDENEGDSSREAVPPEEINYST